MLFSLLILKLLSYICTSKTKVHITLFVLYKTFRIQPFSPNVENGTAFRIDDNFRAMFYFIFFLCLTFGNAKKGILDIKFIDKKRNSVFLWLTVEQ